MPRAPRRPRPLTPEVLERIALAYLGRFASSAENLRRVLLRRLRSPAAQGTDPDQAAAWIDALIARLRRHGLLNDQAYAEGRVLTLARQGRPVHAIGRALAAKGVAHDDIERALGSLPGDRDAADLAAAAAYARRRRLGPWRLPEERPSWYDKDMAALGRRGFDPGTARRVILADSVDALEAEIGLGRDTGRRPG